jgi:hypothetical protein
MNNPRKVDFIVIELETEFLETIVGGFRGNLDRFGHSSPRAGGNELGTFHRSWTYHEGPLRRGQMEF